MPTFEYKVIPAPEKGKSAKGVRSPQDRIALAMAEIMNELGAEGWEYVRCDTLPVEERKGFTGSETQYRNMLVFKRQKDVDELMIPPVAASPVLVQKVPPAQLPAPQPSDQGDSRASDLIEGKAVISLLAKRKKRIKGSDNDPLAAE